MSSSSSNNSNSNNEAPPSPTFNEIMNKAANSALRGGIAGAAAMGANVACLMWMRTTVRFFCVCDILVLNIVVAVVCLFVEPKCSRHPYHWCFSPNV